MSGIEALDLYYKEGYLEEKGAEQIEKELKALDIIKNKRVNGYNLNATKDYEEYNNYCFRDYMKLTQEEFVLLKEVLGNE